MTDDKKKDYSPMMDKYFARGLKALTNNRDDDITPIQDSGEMGCGLALLIMKLGVSAKGSKESAMQALEAIADCATKALTVLRNTEIDVEIQDRLSKMAMEVTDGFERLPGETLAQQADRYAKDPNITAEKKDRLTSIMEMMIDGSAMMTKH